MHFISGTPRCAQPPELGSQSKVNLINPNARMNEFDFRMRLLCVQFRGANRESSVLILTARK